MGEPAALSAADVEHVRDLARRFVDSVRNDEPMPEPFDTACDVLDRFGNATTDRFEVLLLRMAQVITGDVHGGEDCST